MMDGYSVQDAASVLGVPEGRVWELLARGVLSGTPEGDSMRVFLKADAPAPPRPAPREELLRGNGNGGSHGGEASAFRELLTEFRNLTERYGQALLALGEARGEVAGLRSRVELLEARIDLRVPSRMDAEPVSWAAPSLREPEPQTPLGEARPLAAQPPEAPAPEPPAPAEVEALLPTPAPVERASRSRRARSPRAAVAGFADALARAQDPNLAPVDKLAPSEAIVAEEIVEEELTISPALDTDTEPVPVAEVELEAPAVAAAVPDEAAYLPAEVEPDWFADGDFSWLDAAELEAHSQPAAVAVEVVAATPEPIVESQGEANPEPAVEPEEATVAVLAAEPEPVTVAPVQPEPESATSPPIPQIQALEVGGAAEETVPRLEANGEPAHEIEAAPRSYPGPTLSTRIRDAFEPVPWPAIDRGAVAVETAPPPPLAMTEAELMQLARDEGWDDAEVAAIRAMITQPPNAPVTLPGSAELDEAISALQAVPIAPRSDAPPANQWAKAATRESEPIGRDDWAFEVEPALPYVASAQQQPGRREAANPDWLRRRRGPAAEAYRRIRRIFTG